MFLIIKNPILFPIGNLEKYKDEKRDDRRNIFK